MHILDMSFFLMLCAYMFSDGELMEVPSQDYLLDEQLQWTEETVQSLLTTAEKRYMFSLYRTH